MDFLAAMRKKLEEFEQQARLLAEQQQADLEGALRPGRERQTRNKGKGPSTPSPQERRASAAAAEQASAPSPSGSQPGRLGPRLVDDLHGRLDEAFLLSEILGPPRCVKGWESP